MLATLRKFGAASAKKTKTAISAMKVRAFRSRRSAASPPRAGDGSALASELIGPLRGEGCRRTPAAGSRQVTGLTG